jgi:hypothetical protein
MNVRPMHLRAPAAVVLAAMAIAACSPSQAAGPLTLEDRVPGAEGAPGSEPDPRETQVVVTGLDEFEAEILVDVPDVTDVEVQTLEDAGFVSAIADTRFYPTEEGAGHSAESVHLSTFVLQFDSPEGAREAAELMQAFELRTCPETCAFTSAEFEVDGLPDAFGAQRIATQESLDAVGDPGEPQAVYAIVFADGPYVYDIALSGPPEEVSEQEAEELAQALYGRVAGAPPAE